jgi:hypothetical protein
VDERKQGGGPKYRLLGDKILRIFSILSGAHGHVTY